ncbi:MAG: ATP synthase subunit I [Deltaproteobacteria bacterium]|nr:ATP synthase subunit I [Deltaproteobacteria bacterium]
MAPEIASSGPKGLISASTAYKIAAVNLAVGLGGTVVTALIKNSLASGFAAGYIIGVLNIFWLVRIVRKGINLDSKKAGRMMAGGYYARFAATAVVMTYIVAKGILTPLPLLLGFTGSIFATVGVTIFVAMEEF